MPRAIEGHQLRILAGLLAQPGAESAALLREWAAAHPWLAPAILELAGLPLGAWQAEHTRLFISGQPHTACPPFASAYLHGQMNGPVVEDLAWLYDRLGVAPAAELPGDYLGTLLECAAWLHEEGRHGSPEWSELWEQHLGSWVPRFATDLRRESALLLYRLLGERLERLFATEESG